MTQNRSEITTNTITTIERFFLNFNRTIAEMQISASQLFIDQVIVPAVNIALDKITTMVNANRSEGIAFYFRTINAAIAKVDSFSTEDLLEIRDIQSCVILRIADTQSATIKLDALKEMIQSRLSIEC